MNKKRKEKRENKESKLMPFISLRTKKENPLRVEIRKLK